MSFSPQCRPGEPSSLQEPFLSPLGTGVGKLHVWSLILSWWAPWESSVQDCPPPFPSGSKMRPCAASQSRASGLAEAPQGPPSSRTQGAWAGPHHALAVGETQGWVPGAHPLGVWVLCLSLLRV